MTYALDVSRLLAIPYGEGQDLKSGEIDCMHLVKQVLARNGFAAAASTISPIPSESVAIAGRILAGELPEWETVGDCPADATDLCDVLMGELGDGALHVAILVSVRPRLILTTYIGRQSILERPERAWWVTSVLRCRP